LHPEKKKQEALLILQENSLRWNAKDGKLQGEKERVAQELKTT
jgi:hypothetical protein